MKGPDHAKPGGPAGREELGPGRVAGQTHRLRATGSDVFSGRQRASCEPEEGPASQP